MPRRFGRGRKVCTFCVDKVEGIDYKSVNRIRRYMSDRARIESGKRTGTCARHQRMLRLAIKRARFLAMLPLATNHLRVTGPVSQGGRGPAAATPADDIAPIAAEDGDLLESEEDGEDVSQGEERDGGDEKS
jgi:small subunit ribosomal protein S18